MHRITSAQPIRFIHFLLQPFLILLLHFAVILFSGEPGGSVGMIPLLAVYAIAIHMAALLFLYLIVGVLLKYRNRPLWIVTGAIVFELAIILVNEETSLMFLFAQGTDRVVNLSFLLPNMLATIITLLATTKLSK